ncbi:Uncharacterized protein APZ42_006890 [Daphnia magna]|uniref:Uncharacterized protein n=1 Tax=Daphnia magna TaxID=35525 RepID=A0A164FMX8_9CRUS|nr:Uncharacterized protein APZ42_006890 [Daphnia magna]
MTLFSSTFSLKKPLTPQRPQVHLLPPPGSKSMIAWIQEKTMLGKVNFTVANHNSSAL